ncbi:MAG: hypothetical protein IPJ11_08755 [Gemmatimonadetes bacterium]|nr:hypothetical protein [Gemmatimonadota bacterium]
MSMYDPLPDETRERLAELKLPRGNSIATLSDLGWAVRTDAEATLMRHARMGPGATGPIDWAIQLATTRLAAGGLLALGDSGPVGHVAMWYATRIVEVLLGTAPRFEGPPGTVAIQASIVMRHADLVTMYRFRDTDGHLVPFDPPD